MTGSGAAGSEGKLDRLIAASKIVNSTLDLDELLALILDTAVQGVGADRGTLYLLDAARGELWSKVLQGGDLVEIRLPVGTGIAGHVAKTGESVVIPDAYRDPRFHPDVDRRSGYRTRDMLCMPLKDKDGRTIGVFQLLNKRAGAFDRDDQEYLDALSAQAAVAVEYARMAQELVRSERLSAVGRMAGSIVHDLKSPMATVRLYAESLRARAHDAEERGLAEEIIAQVDRFRDMAQQILDFVRGAGAPTFQELGNGEVLESFLHFVEKDLGRGGVRVVRDLRYTGPVRMDQERLRRAFHNIFGNARDAMPRGGTLRVATARRGGTLCIEFADTGVGMTDEVRRRAGEPFFTHGKRQGTGLGLAMVRKTVDEHHGTVEIESAPGAGTTVRLLLPLAPA
jgi:signal transduction histidine kinase